MSFYVKGFLSIMVKDLHHYSRGFPSIVKASAPFCAGVWTDLSEALRGRRASEYTITGIL